MPTGIVTLTPPSAEPVSLTELKQWLRVDLDWDGDDTLISSLGVAARKIIENEYDLSMVTQTLLTTYDRFPRYSSSGVWQFNSDAIWQQRLPVTQLSGQWYPDRASIRLPRPPMQSVVQIQFVDAGTGLLTTVNPSVYNVDPTTLPGRVAPAFGQIWPIVQQQLGAVQCTFVAGFGTPAAVPDTLKTAVKMTVAQWYENREEPDDIPAGVKRILMSEWDGEYR